MHGTTTAQRPNPLPVSDVRPSALFDLAQLKAIPEVSGEVVYAIRASTGQVKFGTTKDLRRRFTDLQAASPVRLDVVAWFDGNRDVEAVIHHEFSSARCHGEWFQATTEVLGFVANFTLVELRRVRQAAADVAQEARATQRDRLLETLPRFKSASAQRQFGLNALPLPVGGT